MKAVIAAGLGAWLVWAPRVQAEPHRHAWFEDLANPTPAHEPLDERFEPPQGYNRIRVAPDSFARWLRSLPIRVDRMQVLSHAGDPLRRPSAGVVLMDVGKRDLMQCADSVIRLHAEYLWARGRSDEAAYRFTSGDRTRWADWVGGERFRIEGPRVVRSKGAARKASHSSYRQWLDLVFTYAGTLSLARDAAKPAVTEPIEAGDFYVEGGSPGHAVIVLDVVENAAGERLALMGQGFMPAEDIHVLRSSKAKDGVWFSLPSQSGEWLDTPSWRPFAAESRRRLH